ncbi:DeoR/GlpR family DNA-binding transcription regulator [Collimonas sp.]|jgi:DeoR/GlpR family transcriptional regulator of sugar metabolism|uniref:DeoR/GlpR family DNA-binding transcription regulator n=1 Tax=Collimonas sp. TaxID=1963772 RepID=UPI002C05D59B|nr:DeoR/GlpR family DNA-binding transcription regulator [Collimonas sp.]HWW07851.1 DeoR/GlpR family DNA-binding transcription regulator [Collimonas sp.]
MLTLQRKQHLLEILERDGQIVAKLLSEQLGLSEDTIRRDLRQLAKEGLLQRVHGGALPASPATATFVERQQISSAAKPAIGRAAAAMIQPGQVVFIDGGTTAVQLARQLPPALRATVVTHSPSIALELLEHPQIEVIMIGGRLFKHSIVSVGAAAIEAIGQIRADLYFMGVCSLHPEAGISTGDYEEACVKRALCNAALKTVVLASPEKLDTASPFQIAPLTQVSEIVVNAGVAESLIAPYRKMGIAVTLA